MMRKLLLIFGIACCVLVPFTAHSDDKTTDAKDTAKLPDGYEYFVGIVGNPSVPDIDWSDEDLEAIKDLGVNMVQLSIAWGNKPADEVLNLEDLDEEQLAKFEHRVKQAEKHGLRTIAHFGVPRMLNYSPVRPACIMDQKVRDDYVRRITEFMERFPAVNDILIYTYDQRAWLCSEYGPCPRCSGLPLDERLPEFINLLKSAMRNVRPDSRLWWKPWEISKGQTVAILDQITPENFGLMLNPSSSNEVYPFNDRSFESDLGVKRLVKMAHERNVPVIGEFDHTLYKPLYLFEDYFPRCVYEQMHGWKNMDGIVGIKEYYGFAPEVFSVNAAMLKAWINSPDASLDELLAEIAAPYGEKAAPIMIEAWEKVAQSVEAFPWDTTYLIGPMGLDRSQDGSHSWEPVTISASTWQTPIWQANRRANFMLTQEHRAHPWLFEDAGLRLEDSAVLAFEAVALFDKAIAAGGPMTDDIRMQREAVWKVARAMRGKGLHFLETLAAQDARMVKNDPKQFTLVVARLEKLLEKDVENQGGNAAAAEKLASLRKDPKAWVDSNLAPRDYESIVSPDWTKWTTDQE